MKTVFAFIAICFVAIACSTGANKNFTTGMSYTYNGFRVGEAYLVNGQNQKSESNEVSVGETIAIVVEDIEGYELKESRAFPGLDIVVTDKDTKVVLEGDDILANEEGYVEADAAVLRGTITVGDPLQSGQTYHAKMKIWDKLKPENVVTVEVDIIVK